MGDNGDLEKKGTFWGPKIWKRSPWGPGSPNGDPFGSSGSMYFFCRTSLESRTTSSKMRCLHCRFSLGLVWVWPWGGFWICFNRPQRCTWGYQPNFFWKSVFEELPTTHNMFLTPHSEQILVHQVLYQKPFFVPTKVVHPIFFFMGGGNGKLMLCIIIFHLPMYKILRPFLKT